MAVYTVNLSTVWQGLKFVVFLAYKAAFLFLAYVLVDSTIRFYGFAQQAAMAFYRLGQHAGI